MTAVHACPTCPWRLSSDPSGVDIPGYDLQRMRRLAETTASRDGSDGFFVVMACHHSEEGDDVICRGYAAKHGYDNIRVRLMAASGAVDLPGIVDAAEGVPMYGSIFEMVAAMNEAAGESQ